MDHDPVPDEEEFDGGASPPLNSTDDRTLRTRNRVRKKLQQRRINSNDGGYYPNNHSGPGPRSMGAPRRGRGGPGGAGMPGVNGDLGSMHIEASVAHTQCSSPAENGQLDMEEDHSAIVQCLSAVPLPKVTGVEARISRIQLAPPECDSLELDLSDLKYELYLSDKGRDGNYELVFCGKTTELKLKDLTPFTEYNIKCCALLGDNLKGALSEPVGFRTLQCEPEAPAPPKVIQKGKTMLALRWNPPELSDRYTHALALCWKKLSGGEDFHLQMEDGATVRYARFICRYSEVVSFHTNGLPPSTPEPPELSDRYTHALALCWKKLSGGEDFHLQMEDGATGHGFWSVYNGQNQGFTVSDLKRNTSYKFRLSVKNDAGQSPWSQTVCYSTKPERPHRPSKPQIKGKVNPHSFRITWDPPSDSGGTDITKYIVELDDGQGYDTVYEGSEREHTFDHLRPGHTYRVRVACCSVGGRSDFSDCCVATTLPVVPGSCHAPKLHGKPKAKSLHLKWGYPDYDGGAQVSSFGVQMISSDNSTQEVFKGHDRACIVGGLLPGRSYLFQVQAFNRAGLYVGPSTSFDVKGLAPATTYTFRVQAINSAGPGLFSPVAQYQTPASSPGPIASIKVVPDATWARLSWRQPHTNGSDITSYNIDVSDRPTPLSVDPLTEYLLEGLQPETTYKIRVQAVNSIGVGPYSNSVKVTTRALPPSPPRLECMILAPSSIKLKWGEGRNSDLLTYTLEMEKEDGSFQPVYTGPAHTHKVTRLAELTTYEFRIFASNEAGAGPYSDTYSFTTTKTPPPPLRAPKVTSVSPHGCCLEWASAKPLGGDSTAYVLQLLCLNGRDTEYKQVYRGPNTTPPPCPHPSQYYDKGRETNPNLAVTLYTTVSPCPGLPRAQHEFPPGRAVHPHGVPGPRGCGQTLLGPVGRHDRRVQPGRGVLPERRGDPGPSRGRYYRFPSGQVYRGPNTSFQLDELSTHTEYQARVAAVRLSSDQSGDMTGAFSPGVVFSPSAAETQAHHSSATTHGASGQGPASASTGAEGRRPWTDQQWAAVILLGFLLVAVVSAYACHILVTYMGGDSASQFSSSSSSSSSSQSSGGSAPSSSSSSGSARGRGFS
ncbi:hypothetical protein EGW08_014700 [Elysia chlorotica]|uniref:Fibronectin type-III domain-containing protein n=1 Tax=Elysia chlorotica TaxID=188477 RepID=A0A433T7K6_ELYCH|nr:hypothetical protein EGW08_014700 [Elysia chlorotica]